MFVKETITVREVRITETTRTYSTGDNGPRSQGYGKGSEIIETGERGALHGVVQTRALAAPKQGE